MSQFTTSDTQTPTLPANFTFSAGDDGTHTFIGEATLFTAPSQTLTVSDGAFTDTQSVTVNAATAASISLIAPAEVTASAAFDVTVTAFDEFGNLASGPNAYTGQVWFHTWHGMFVASTHA